MGTAVENRQSEIVARIIAGACDRAAIAQVEDVRIGLGYTAVSLDDDRTGVAYTFRDEARRGCSVFSALRPIAGRPAAELIELLGSNDPIEACVGLACANAVVNQPNAELEDGDIMRHVEIGPDDHVGMVGHFAPLVARLNERARKLTIFERIPEPRGNLRPVAEAPSVLADCQVALITGTSIINHTIDELLAASSSCRRVIVLGASTPLLRDAFENSAATVLSGVLVTQPESVRRVVSEGGGMRLFKPHVGKVNLALR